MVCAPRSFWIYQDRCSQKTTITQHDLWKPSPEGGKLKAGERGECYSREKLQFVSL